MGTFDDLTWQALTAVLTLLGLAGSAALWRRRGAASGLRLLALSLLPAAAYLTGTLRLLWEIGDAVVSWAARLVLSPSVWLGLALAGCSALLLVVSGAMRRRGVGKARPAAGSLPSSPSRAPASTDTGPRTRAGDERDVAGQDQDLDEIEAILRRHGIS